MHIPLEWVRCARALQEKQQQQQLVDDDVNLQEM